MNTNRKFAITCISHPELVENIIKALPINSDITLFQDINSKNIINVPSYNVNIITLPEEINTTVKIKNYVISTFKNNGFTGKLHIIEDTIQILKNPQTFIDDIERIMDLLDINSYLCTITDTCNLLYQKYNPRLKLINDKPEWQKFNINDFIFCSHSNIQWMIFDIGRGDENELTFNEQFTIAMFWIIEYLARRRNTHPDSLYFMNQYITCSSEIGVFKRVAQNESDLQISQEIMKAEDAAFKSMEIDYKPDNNIDIILERLANKLDSKI